MDDQEGQIEMFFSLICLSVIPLLTADCLSALTLADVHVASAYFLLLLIYHFRTWAPGRQNLSLFRTATGSPLKHKCGWAPGGAECSPYAPGLSPGPALLLCPVLVMDELWGMMNRLLSGPKHILIWDSDAKKAERHHHSALYSRIWAILNILHWVIWLISHILKKDLKVQLLYCIVVNHKNEMLYFDTDLLDAAAELPLILIRLNMHVFGEPIIRDIGGSSLNTAPLW